jgi:hypothetical protein
MLQNTVSDVTNLSHVKQLRYPVVARDKPLSTIIWSYCCQHVPLTTKITSRLALPNAMCIPQILRFYDSQDGAVLGVDTNV